MFRPHGRGAAGGIAAAALLAGLLLASNAGAGAPSPSSADGRSGSIDGAGAGRSASLAPAAATSPDANNSGAKYGIPPWYTIHPNGKVGQGFDVTTATSRPKVTLHLPPISALVHLYLCFNFGGTARCVDPTADPGVLKPYPTLGSAGLAVGYGPAWFQSGKGSSRPFGELAGVHVAALAFGSIPVTATVHIIQPMGKKYVRPLKLKFAAGLSNVSKGTKLAGFDFGPAPFDSSAAYLPSTVDGSIVVRLSNLRVDQVPVHVGAHCQAPGSSLHLTSPAGWANAMQGPQKGEPGEYQGLGATDFGYLQGNADVAAFTGCHNGGDDLDPLITSFISSDDNPVDVDVTSGLINWCTNDIGSTDCAPYDGTSPKAVAAEAGTSGPPKALTSTLPAPIARALARQFGTTTRTNAGH